MHHLIQTVLNSEEKEAFRELVDTLIASEKSYFLRNEILHIFADYCHQSQKPSYFFHASSLGQLFHYTHEILLEDAAIWLLIRPWVGSQQIWWIDAALTETKLMPPQAILEARDRYVHRSEPQILGIDFGPFYENLPSIQDPRNIGQGFLSLNRYLCSKVVEDPHYWLDILFDVLHRHEHDGLQLLINDRIHSGDELVQQIAQARRFVSQRDPDEPYEVLHTSLQEMGFEPGWGNTASRVRETLELLDRLIESPEPAILEAFVARIPAVFRIVSISIHGWVGQEYVLGRPETMGQVIYVLEQARSLENQLREDLHLAGLDVLGIKPHIVILTRLIPNCEGTHCNLPLERIEDTDNAWILRVPFREFNPKVTQNWVSKFQIWPYLEGFALDAEIALRSHLKGGSPNLIIGNYSDGNLVAFLLARRLNTLHCNIAHSLEKPKYLFSNLYWSDLEEQYHFSAQFSADLISMNAADFIVTASYEEIVGTPDSMGQYESYKCFSMPHLYHVLDGIDLFSPKFNRVPPGVDDRIFFPYYEMEKRDPEMRSRLEQILFEQQSTQILGQLQDPDKRPILAIAPLTVTKNLTGLVECFGRSPELKAHCNLILMTTKLQLAEAANAEESREIEKLHQMIDQYQLHHNLRWIGMRLFNADMGETYRIIADKGGIFVHFARFEALGRVILEAMVSGLPTFATQFGGALEVVEDGISGFLINPTDLEETAQKIVQEIQRYNAEPQYWQDISHRGIQRIHDTYTWKLHTRQLLLLTKIYSFWNYVHHDRREALLRYLEALFHLIYKPRAALILEQHAHR